MRDMGKVVVAVDVRHGAVTSVDMVVETTFHVISPNGRVVIVGIVGVVVVAGVGGFEVSDVGGVVLTVYVGVIGVEVVSEYGGVVEVDVSVV